MRTRRRSGAAPAAMVLGGALMLAAFIGSAPVASAQNSVSSGPGPGHAGLIEETGFLAVQGAAGTYRLEMVAVRPAKAEGRLPIALITHGKQRLGPDMARMLAELMQRQARDLAHRGYLAVAVVRRGFGRSDGTPGVADNARYAKCSVADLTRYFAVEAEQLDGALRAIARRPDADATRALAIGASVGGGAMLALAARRPPGLRAVVNIAGGVRLTNAQGEVACPFDTVTAALGSFGAEVRIPSLWLYAENDDVFRPETARSAHAAFTRAGGVADLRFLPALKHDGHHAFEMPDGRMRWLAGLDDFLRTLGLPTWRAADVDAVIRRTMLPPNSRAVIENYFSLYTPKVLVQARNSSITYTADTRDIARARDTALRQCAERSGAPCRMIMENFDLLPIQPDVRASATR